MSYFCYQDILTNTVFGVFKDLNCLKFQKARTKKLSCVCPVGCLSSAETANRADSGQLQFWYKPSENLNVRSSNTPKTVAFTIP